MLREWSAAGFVTRDFVNFDEPFIQPPAFKVEKPAPTAALTATARAAAAPTTVAKPATAAQPAQPNRRASPRSTQVSVNSASVEDLSSIKGMPEKVAKVIVKERPFRSLDELVRVKGMGAKLLAKIRSSLKL